MNVNPNLTLGKRSNLDRSLSRFRFSTRARETFTGYLLITPLLLIFLVYYVYAIFRSLWMSFTDYKFVTPEATTFVALRNYTLALQDENVLFGFLRAGQFTLLYYVGAFLLPLMVAMTLDRVYSNRLATVYRVLLYIPAVIPGPLVFRLWRWVYAPSIGLLNYMGFNVLHVFPEQPNWLSDPSLIMFSLVSIHWWWAIGLMTVFFLVGLAAIPDELYEAARLDGAAEWQLIRHVTLPLLKGTIMVWAIIRIQEFGITVPMLILWGSGNVAGAIPTQVQTWGWYAYMIGFVRGRMNMGYASAVGWSGALLMVAVALFIRWLFREESRQEEET
jgi:ABC-type sugar transport system permease subunit